MRKLRISSVILLAALIIGVLSFGPPCLAGSAPWEISYHDGSGNAFRFWQDTGVAEARFDYAPVTPQESSSGVYSGGEAKSGPLDEKRAKKLWRLVRQLELDSPLHAGSRGMGTGAFRIKDAGGTREFIVKESPSLRGFNRFLAELPPANLSSADGIFPIYPQAVKDTRQSGATTLQPGKNYSVSVYTVKAPLAEVLRFYQTRLKNPRQLNDADGSVKLTTDGGSVRLMTSGALTKIQMTQGPK